MLSREERANKRPWYVFGTRTLLLGVLLFGVILMPLVSRWHRYQRQSALLTSLSNIGLNCEYHRGTRLPWWRYLLTTEQLTDDVSTLYWWSPSLSVQKHHDLSNFRRLETLWVRQHTAMDVKPLAGMSRLRLLRLEVVALTDITPLAGLTQLEDLRLWRTRVADISPLSKLTKLEVLCVTGAPLSDVTPLAALTQLKQLDLSETNVADLRPLTELTQLRHLSLWQTKVSDVTPLADLTELKTLHLWHTKVKDLTPLAKMDDVQIYVDNPEEIVIPDELKDRVQRWDMRFRLHRIGSAAK